MERVGLGLLVPVAALLLAGCGGQPPARAAQPTNAAPATRHASESAGDGLGVLAITQLGERPPNTLWYARIETPEGKPVLEAVYPVGPIAMEKRLQPGRYRAISWHRPCAGACPTSGENGLGALTEVCGVPVTVTSDRRVTATVVIGEAGGCTVRL